MTTTEETLQVRRAVNTHLWRRHERMTARGNVEDRLAQHLRLHETTECDHEHYDWSADGLEEMNNDGSS